MKHLALALCLFATACKSEKTESTQANGSATPVATDPGAQPKRDGKIPMAPFHKRPRATDDDPMDDDAGGSDHEAMREKFEQMRKEREAKLDTDGDGKISEAERDKARHDRAVSMRDKLDANADGKLTVEEINASPRLSRRLGDPSLVDTNKDGDISADEIDTAMKLRVNQFGGAGPKFGGMGGGWRRHNPNGSGSGQ